MKNIKVIFTGGTIGSLQTENDINTNTQTQYLLLKKYGKRLQRFQTTCPLNILSENATLSDIMTMKNAILTAQNAEICGIIMTHGSDTLAITSAYLSLLLPNLKVPVVLVASNKILTDDNTNGVVNFESAVALLDNTQTKPNIYVAYKNTDDDFVSFHYGAKICEPMPLSENFKSVNNDLYGTYKNEKITIMSEKTSNAITLSNATRLTPKDEKLLSLVREIEHCNTFTKSGIFLSPFTSLDYNNYNNCNPAFFLHSLYHSGTANTSKSCTNFATNLLEFADHCTKIGTPLYLCNAVKKDANYNSALQLQAHNIKFLYGLVPQVAYAKLNLAYNFISLEDERELYLNSTINNENI